MTKQHHCRKKRPSKKNVAERGQVTGVGKSEMKRGIPAAEANNKRSPATITEGNNSSIPGPLLPTPAGGMRVATTAEKPGEAPFTMPGRPPNRPTISPTIQAAWRAMGGFIFAMNANAIDSGI